MKKRFLLVILIAVQSIHGYSQSSKDSVTLSTIASEFFNWYIACAKTQNSSKFKEYNPVGVRDASGMTTLDFSTYFQNLKNHSFSDSLLAKEKRSYNNCLRNLAKVKYDDYLKFQDLDDFEGLHCDYTNYYRWTGGQEMYDGYVVTQVMSGKKSTLVFGNLYMNDEMNKGIGISKRTMIMTFRKQKGEWKILDIQH